MRQAGYAGAYKRAHGALAHGDDGARAAAHRRLLGGRRHCLGSGPGLLELRPLLVRVVDRPIAGESAALRLAQFVTGALFCHATARRLSVFAAAIQAFHARYAEHLRIGGGCPRHRTNSRIVGLGVVSEGRISDGSARPRFRSAQAVALRQMRWQMTRCWPHPLQRSFCRTSI